MTAETADARQLDLQEARKVLAGDRMAFHAIIERLSPSLVRTARGLCRCQADAEDVVQEALMESFRSLRTYDGQSRLLTWMTRILIRRAHRIWKKSSKYPRPVSMDSTVTDAVDDPALETQSASVDVDRRLDLAAVLEDLSPEHRQVLVLRELQGMSYGEIGATLKIAAGTVESRLFRARAALRERLGRYGTR